MLTLMAPVPSVGLDATELPTGYEVRPCVAADTRELGRLYFDAYDPGVACDTLGAAVDDIRASFDGAYGQLLHDGSPVAIAEDGAIVSAVLTVRRAPYGDAPDCPFIIEMFTDRAHRRRGLARALLVHVLARLSERGDAAIALRVDEDNTPAVDLYRSLGFRPWVR